MTCRIAELMELLAHFDGVAIDELPACAEPAVHRTRIHRELADGSIVVTARAELCDAHDAALRLDDGYGGSWVIRRDPSHT